MYLTPNYVEWRIKCWLIIYYKTNRYHVSYFTLFQSKNIF